MPLSTNGGDQGYTSLGDGSRVPKSDARVAVFGDMDELSSLLGWCRCALTNNEPIGARLADIQRDLFAFGAELAAGRPGHDSSRVNKDRIDQLQQWIDEACQQVEPATHFVLPGGTETAARLHVARVCCRRVERAVVGLQANISVREDLIVYLNRLGDLLFAWARQVNYQAGVPDAWWVPSK